MIREEIQIVRRRLDDYSSYKVLASEADRKSLETQALIDSIGNPQSPKWGSVPVQNHTELATKLNDLVSDQMYFDAEARNFHEKMLRIETYIRSNYSKQVIRIMELHYLEGIPFDEMEDILGVSASGIKNAVYRAMEAEPFIKARPIL